MKYWIWLAGIVLGLVSCQDAPGSPKPRAYPRVEYPAHEYQEYDTASCPFTFQYPRYATIRDRDQPCWFDIAWSPFNARIHCSYVKINSKAEYDDLVRDAYVIAYKINERSNYMNEIPFRNPQGIGGLMFNWTGPAASPIHFFLTDTTHHFFKAALYFDSKVQPDSLAPIVEFIQNDIDQMISTFTWKH
jgi:gliding motility-associated lipoprotein GldD